MWFLVVILGVLAGLMDFDWPPSEAALMLAFIAMVLIRRKRSCLISVATGVGILAYLYTNVYLAVVLSQTLPVTLTGKNLLIRGAVVQVHHDSPDRQQFTFDVDQCWQETASEKSCNFQGAVVLNRYLPRPAEPTVESELMEASDADLRVEAGEQWQFLVRLYPVRGFSNPGQSRYRMTQLGKGVLARGYVRDEAYSLRQDRAGQWQALLNGWRSGFIARANTLNQPLVNTLLTGDSRGLTDHHWQLLRQTGTVHLVVVSGLHIGVLLGAGWFLLSLLSRCLPLDRYWQRVLLLVSPVLLLFPMLLIWPPGIAVSRALLMALLVIFLRVRGIFWSPLRILLLVVTVLLLSNPFYLLHAGFYYSVWAVALLLLVVSGGRHKGLFLRIQLVLMTGLLPLQAFWLNTPDLVSGVVNLVAIPLVSVLILPLALLEVILPVMPFDGLLSLLDAVFWQWLILGLELDWGIPVLDTGSALMLLFLALIWAFPAVPARNGLSLMIISVLLRVSGSDPVSDREPEFSAQIFDVGQGLAVRIKVGEKQLVYDTGPAYRSGFQPVALFLPQLLASESARIDQLVVSHDDNDHAGGLTALTSFAEQILAGQPERLDKTVFDSVRHIRGCHQGQVWRWEQVVVDVLYPPARAMTDDADRVRSDNDRSCVLKIRSEREPEKSLLLTGDIGHQAEGWLLASGQDLSAEWLVASHHGSAGGNSLAFLAAVAPRGIIYSAGFNNRYGHPAADVQRRIAYLRRGELRSSEIRYREYNTADLGALYLTDSGTNGRWRLVANREQIPVRWRWQRLE